MKPVSLQQISDQVLVVKWDNDSESVLFADKLRKNCPCATCRDAKEEKPLSPFKILKSHPDNILFINWEFVGNYAIRFTFNDNHSTGIYTYEVIKKLGD